MCLIVMCACVRACVRVCDVKRYERSGYGAIRNKHSSSSSSSRLWNDAFHWRYFGSRQNNA